jgi:hypothetical protein
MTISKLAIDSSSSHGTLRRHERGRPGVVRSRCASGLVWCLERVGREPSRTAELQATQRPFPPNTEVATSFEFVRQHVHTVGPTIGRR